MLLCCAARMKIVRPMTQADSASSGRASTGGWKGEGVGGEKGWGWGVAEGSTRAEATGSGGVGGRMW